MKRHAAAAVVLASLLLGCSHTPHHVGTADARNIVEERGVVFSAAVVAASTSAWRRNDVNALVSLYTDDATLFPPDQPAVRGREEITRYWSRTPDRRVLAHNVSVEHAEYSGSLLYEYGTFSGTFEVKGVEKTATARYVSVWRLDTDGTWRKHLDTWW